TAPISCDAFTPDAEMKAMLGQKINLVIMQWGAANNVQPDGSGGYVYSWYFARQGYTASRTFLADKDGKIYAYRWQGL
ncbi:MAG: hypothetical protein ACLFQX_10820, partial [Candidatus Kapaibacterium sp.]